MIYKRLLLGMTIAPSKIDLHLPITDYTNGGQICSIGFSVIILDYSRQNLEAIFTRKELIFRANIYIFFFLLFYKKLSLERMRC